MLHPAFKVSVLFIAGILVDHFLHVTFQVILAIAIFSISLICLTYHSAKKSIPILISSSILILSLGMFRSYADEHIISPYSLKFVSDSALSNPVKLKGTIIEIPDIDSARIRFTVIAKQIITANDTLLVNGEVVVDMRKNKFSKSQSAAPQLFAGDELFLTGELTSPPESRNPGEFNYRNYLANKYVYKILYVRDFENAFILSHNNLGFFHERIIFPAKYFCLGEIDRTFSGDEAAYLKGLITGVRYDISPELKDAFVNSGVMHLMAVSGLNVAYIIISMGLVLSLLRLKPSVRTFIIILFIIFYCYFTGNSSSIIRAGIMGILALTAYLLERKIDFYNMIGVASLCILIFDSKQLFDPGFILSFSAVLSMTFFMSVFENRFMKNLIRRKTKIGKFLLWASALFFTSLSAQIGTIPITAIYFEKISIVSLFVNLAAVPLANISLAIGFFQMLVAPFSIYAADVIADANYVLLSVQISLIRWSANLEFAYVNAASVNVFDVIFYYSVVVLLFTSGNMRTILARLVISILLAAILLLNGFNSENKLSVTFFDVGQGDCSLIKTPDGRIILIDCGRAGVSFDSGERTIAPYLRRNSINKIDLLIITHLHDDHIGGVNYILRNFEVGKILESSQLANSEITSRMNELISEKHIDRVTIRSGMFTDDIPNLRMYFLFPSDEFMTTANSKGRDNLNNGSVTFLLHYRSLKMLFTGDIEKEAEELICKTYSQFLKSNVLKVAHHGSRTSSTPEFINFVKPEFAVISCGAKNKFKHPSPEVLKRFEQLNTALFRTDLDRAVIFESDGSKFERIEWK